jgi:hypothetical protein
MSHGPRPLLASLPSAARAAQRLASASGYMDWWTLANACLEASGEPLMSLREAAPLWAGGWDEEGAAHELVRRRAMP